MNKPYVVPSTARRDLWIGIGVAAALLAAILFGLKSLSTGVASSTLTGVVVEKTFTPYREEQITFGQGGIHSRKIDGKYVLECDVEGKRYLVPVDKATYQLRKVGDRYLFARPRE